MPRPLPNLKLASPAKVNLFLKVLRKRPDGYHELHTLFERVSLCDEIILKPLKSGIRIRSNTRNLPKGPKNIAYQAAQLLKEICRVRKGVEICIQKRIPLQAGLGGGSSNAATVLLGLNKLWNLDLSKKELCKLGAKIGSDVPFFVLETPFAEAWGRGEILKPISRERTKFWHVIVKPRLGISTQKAYESLDLEGLTLLKTDAKMLLRSLKKGHAGRLSELLSNSLEVTGNKQLKIIFKLKKELLEQGALASLMSGSGSSVFGLFRTRAKAEKAARFFRKVKNLKVFVAATF